MLKRKKVGVCVNYCLFSPGFWRCRQPLIMFLKSDEICSNLLDKQRKEGVILVSVHHQMVCVFVCHKEITHNSCSISRWPADAHRETVTIWLPRWGLATWLVTGQPVRKQIQRTDPQGQQPIRLCSSSTGEEKLSPKYTYLHYINTHTHIHRGYRPIHWLRKCADRKSFPALCNFAVCHSDKASHKLYS